ncbi:MAG: hypothetical protein LUG62_02430 [Clostridiales bacterium]|nr:hypothetical protein [Clostridiales bacterium]
MKIARYLAPFFAVLFALSTAGCADAKTTGAEQAVKSELDLLKNLDSETVLKYISYQELFPDATENTELSDEIKEVFTLFFQDFDYKILKTTVDQEENTAEVSLRLTTLDAQTLAGDYMRAKLENEILAASAGSGDTGDDTDSLADQYLLLGQLLRENTYDTAEIQCTVTLSNAGTSDSTQWEIQRSQTLENNLVGGFITYLSDPDILSAQDTLSVYLDTLGTMNEETMISYLGLEESLTTSDSAKNAIAQALASQVHTYFAYEITDSTVEGYYATVTTEITTIDSDAIMEIYEAALDSYLDSSDAVIDGSTARYSKSHELLLQSINENTATTTAQATFHLINDGASWKLEDGSAELGNALFGSFVAADTSEDTDE